jgi:hypothetical protein
MAMITKSNKVGLMHDAETSRAYGYFTKKLNGHRHNKKIKNLAAPGCRKSIFLQPGAARFFIFLLQQGPLALRDFRHVM